jgi:hypothetical protein
MNGMKDMKVMNLQYACIIHHYKNNKEKLLKANLAKYSSIKCADSNILTYLLHGAEPFLRS